SIIMNTLGNGTHLNLLLVGSGSEVRVKHSADDSYKTIRVGELITDNNNGDGARVFNSAGSTYIQGDTEIKATKYMSSTYVPVRASSFPTGSLAAYKQDIEVWEGQALELITNSTIYQYRLKSEVEQGKNRIRQGLVIGEGYNTPVEVIDGDGVEQYLMNSISWKAIQELDQRTFDQAGEIEWLRIENQSLRNRLKELETKIA
ncbi:hypothetical protein, partial [Peribacillus muralis]|uniref:hypothetical protein n=1 Tax=Peribacillus muralis TaxID=264697 RepID=UPI003CFEDDBB